jgi:hypothetical protein
VLAVERPALLTRPSESVHVLRDGGDFGEAFERRVHAALVRVPSKALLEALEELGLYS